MSSLSLVGLALPIGAVSSLLVWAGFEFVIERQIGGRWRVLFWGPYLLGVFVGSIVVSDRILGKLGVGPTVERKVFLSTWLAMLLATTVALTVRTLRRQHARRSHTS